MLRGLALRIALLTTEDRHWLLDELSSADRTRVTQLIDEAIEMGLTQNPSILASFSSAKIAEHSENTWIEQAELSQLPLFWQNLIDVYQNNESQKKNLPYALMKSVTTHARESLFDSDGMRGDKVYG